MQRLRQHCKSRERIARGEASCRRIIPPGAQVDQSRVEVILFAGVLQCTGSCALRGQQLAEGSVGVTLDDVAARIGQLADAVAAQNIAPLSEIGRGAMLLCATLFVDRC